MATAAADLPKSSAVYSQSLSLSILPSSLSVTCQFCRQPVSSFSQPASLSGSSQPVISVNRPVSSPVVQPICRPRQSVSQSAGQVVGSHGRSSPSALVPSPGLCRRRGRRSAGGRGAGRQDPDLWRPDAAGLLRAPQPAGVGSLPGFGGFPGTTEGLREEEGGLTRPRPCPRASVIGRRDSRPPRPETEGKEDRPGPRGARAATRGLGLRLAGQGPGGWRPQHGPRSFRDLREEEALLRKGGGDRVGGAELGSLWKAVSRLHARPLLSSSWGPSPVRCPPESTVEPQLRAGGAGLGHPGAEAWEEPRGVSCSSARICAAAHKRSSALG